MALTWLIGFVTVNFVSMRRDLAAGLDLGQRFLRSIQRKYEEPGQLARADAAFVRDYELERFGTFESLTVVIRIREQKGTRERRIRPCAGGMTGGCHIPPLRELYEHGH